MSPKTKSEKVVREGLRGEVGIAELCCREVIHTHRRLPIRRIPQNRLEH